MHYAGYFYNTFVFCCCTQDSRGQPTGLFPTSPKKHRYQHQQGLEGPDTHNWEWVSWPQPSWNTQSVWLPDKSGISWCLTSSHRSHPPSALWQHRVPSRCMSQGEENELQLSSPRSRFVPRWGTSGTSLLKHHTRVVVSVLCWGPAYKPKSERGNRAACSNRQPRELRCHGTDRASLASRGSRPVSFQRLNPAPSHKGNRKTRKRKCRSHS